MLYLCIPSYNEGPTVGVLLWRIRKVFQEYSREYEIIVYDDASTDGTREALEPYKKVMPLTVIGSKEHVGYSRAVEALLRSASQRTKYPRRDAVVLMQADFTDQPEHLPELVKRFEGGADVVAVERVMSASAPEPVRKLARLARWLPRLWPIRSFVTVPGVKDPFGGFRLMRISIVRDLLKEQGDLPFADTPVWATNVELLRSAVRLARRTESVPLESRWDVRPRESRVKPWPDVIDLAKRGVGGPFQTDSESRRVIRSWSRRQAALAGLVLALLATPATSHAQRQMPWAAGETLEYTVRLSGLRAGSGVMQVTGVDTMRGRSAWRLHFNIKGSALGLYHVDDTYDSWMDVESLNSLRFEQNLLEGGTKRLRNYDIFPGRAIFHQEGKEEKKSVPDPLDDASFFFYVRTLPLEIGRQYSFDKYFDPKANPVVIKVIRRDTIDVPAGRFPAIVLQPTFQTNGLFSQNGHAEIWLSDDEHRILLRMDTHFAVFTLGLQLRKVTYGTPAPGKTREDAP